MTGLALTRLSPRGLFWLGLYGVILAAWALLMLATRGAADLPGGFWASLCIAAGQAEYPALLGMWALMTLAMMLPTFLPALRTYVDLGHTGATDMRGAAALVAGYLAVWALACFGAALAQMMLSRAGLLTGLGASASHALNAVLLLGAGAYQFSHVKAACLAKCRMPLTFFMERWAPGTRRAAKMGAELGVLCLGCCWALMALGFVGGTMNLLWMGAATLFMVLEKLPDIGARLTGPAGWALMAAGIVAALRATALI